MGGNILCIAAVLLGVDVGWRPLSKGGVEYLIQIEPHVLETLKSGQPIASDIPTKLKDVRAYRITVGTEELPRELPPEPVPLPREVPASELPALTEPDKDEDRAPEKRGPLPEIVPSAEPDLSGPVAAPPPAIQPDLRLFPEPSTLFPAPDSQPIAKSRAVLAKAVEVEKAVAATVEPKSQPGAKSPASDNPPGREEKPSKPWLLTLFGLFASLGGNVYLVWVAAGFRSRYYAITRQSSGVLNT